MDLTCIHATNGLCPACQADYDEDPLAYLEYGQHAEGIARWEALQAEMAAAQGETPPETGEDVPF